MINTDRKLSRMHAVRPIAISTAAAIMIAMIAMLPPTAIAAEAGDLSGSFVIAQTSMGTSDPISPLPVPTPLAPLPVPTPAPSLAPSPRTDYIPPLYDRNTPDQPDTQAPSTSEFWGAIGFTADGSYWSAWKQPSKGEAEAVAAKGCSKFGRSGGCEVASFSGQECVSLATFIGSYGRRRWSLSFTAGSDTYPSAQNAALARCNADERTRGHCQTRTTVCADGR
jgi:Domain of unknown function (DUF4189)